jgi:hypothetical protein
MQRPYFTSTPVAACPACKKVLMSSPSPHTIIPGNLLNYFPSGTSGRVSSHSANKPSWSAETFRLLIRSSKCSNSGRGKLLR